MDGADLIFKVGMTLKPVIDSVDDPIGTSDWTLKTPIGSVLTN